MFLFLIHFSIGFAIAKQLALDGAKVVVSSRKKANVAWAVEKLKKEQDSTVAGVVCNVATPDHRKNLVEKVAKLYKPPEKMSLPFTISDEYLNLRHQSNS